MMIRFSYSTDGNSRGTRHVFVMAPDADGVLHGVDVDRIKERDVVAMYATAQAEYGGDSSAFPELDVSSVDERGFYDDVYRRVGIGGDAYRTYSTDRMPSKVELVRFTTTLNGPIERYIR